MGNLLNIPQVLKASPGAAIFRRDMLFNIPFVADWKQIGDYRQHRPTFLNIVVGFNFPRKKMTMAMQVKGLFGDSSMEHLLCHLKHGVSLSLKAQIYDNWHFLHPAAFISYLIYGKGMNSNMLV
jgi:hypothetical protein